MNTKIEDITADFLREEVKNFDGGYNKTTSKHTLKCILNALWMKAQTGQREALIRLGYDCDKEFIISELKRRGFDSEEIDTVFCTAKAFTYDATCYKVCW